jgi:hypothetical protein
VATDWAPTVDAVGAQLRARTKDANGNELGTFTEDTRPTGVQVEELIDRATGDMISVLPDPMDPKWNDRASGVAVLGAAMRVELSFFPEQVATGRSPYPQLKALYDDELKRLVNAAQGGDTAMDGSGALAPAGGFPYVTNPIDWDTRF